MPDEDRLRYAFSTSAWLDPGTKLLELGLNGYTPPAALRTLIDKPLHMSVALHEVTHFSSLENTLGRLIAFLALRANAESDRLRQLSERHEPADDEWVGYYLALHRRYALTIEAWRPLLEGLAVYVQTHTPCEAGDALAEPVAVLWMWMLDVQRLGGRTMPPGGPGAPDAFLDAAYAAIRAGPSLELGALPLGAAIELIRPELLRPYFLGHAYVRALQRRLARADSRYDVGELFINLLHRILRSSTRALLAGEPRWDHPGGAEDIYNWGDIVEQAGPDRIRALTTLDDNVDVLQFLSTGRAVVGYSHKDDGAIDDIRSLVPHLWRHFNQILLTLLDSSLRRREEPPLTNSPAEQVSRHWLRGTMALNLSAGGGAVVAGWVERAIDDKHAVAVQIDGQFWWLALDDGELGALLPDRDALRRLDVTALDSRVVPAVPITGPSVLVDCYTEYTTGGFRGNQRVMVPALRFEVYRPERKNESLVMMIQWGERQRISCWLEPVPVSERNWHASSVQMRGIIRRAQGPAGLAQAFAQSGDAKTADLLADGDEAERMALARCQAHVNRRILRSLQGEALEPVSIDVLTRGMGVVAEIEGLAPLVASAYGRPQQSDAATLRRIESINQRSRAIVGKAPFDVDAGRQLVAYCGLWGND